MSDPKTCSVSAAPDSDERSWHTLAWSEPEWSELKQSEQQLAAALYQLGLVLSEQSDAAQITAAQTYQLNALEGLLQTPHWKLLIRHFSLKDAEAALLAVVFLFQLEPDLLAVYSGLSWYEQGPGISAERALSLIPATQGDDFPSNRVNLVLPDCPLIQHGLLIGQDPENPLHQPLNVAGALLALMNRAYSQSTAYETSQAWLSRAACLSGPAASVVYQHQFSMPSAGINVIHAEAQDYREKSAFIQALLQSSASQDDETVLWRLHGVQEYHQATPMIRQALLAARLSTLAATQALYWPTLAEDCDTSEALRVLAGWLIASPQILLFCDQSAAPHTSGQPSGLSLGTEATTSSWFVHTIRCYPVQRFYLQTTTQQRAKGWQALIQKAAEEAATGNRVIGTGTHEDDGEDDGTDDIIFIGTDTHILSDSDAQLLAERYPLSTTQMTTVLDSLIQQDSPLTTHAIQQACLQRMHGATQGLATFTLPRFTFSDMVLTADALAQAEELLARIRFHSQLAAQVPGRLSGTQALFWGPPGTGKSMAAEAIAGELCLPLYKVNLANVASKWIGETEKHLANLFDQAEKQKAVLLFDEADAIFARRSEVESSHDKNANMGVSYLLQRMETYQGVLLLSTNFKANIDDAFLRRFTAVIEFPLPDKLHRKKLWQHVWQGELQPADQIEMDYLIEHFDLSPSQIHNIAERACLFALMERTPQITQAQLGKSLQRELDKQSAGFIAAHHLAAWTERNVTS